MSDVVKTVCTGFGVGIVFGLLRLPIPAPGTLAGVLGIVGIFLGYIAIHAIVH